MEFLTGMNIVLALMNIGMITYIHTSYLFSKENVNYRTMNEGDVCNDEPDTSDDSTYFS